MSPVCALSRLLRGRGVAALVGGEQVAVFRLDDGSVHAVSNIDPFSHAAVIARGIVGDHRGEPKVTSPMYKQSFSLRDGRCFDDEAVTLAVFDVSVIDDVVWVHASSSAEPA